MRTLISLNLRTRRWFLIVWITLLASFVAIMPPAYHAAYAHEEELAALAAPMRENIGLRAMNGMMPDPFTFGSFTVWEAGMWVPLLAAVMSLMLAIRLTRAAEEDGIYEVIRVSGLGARTPEIAAIVVVFIASIILGIFVTLGLLIWVPSLEGITTIGSVLFGALIAVVSAQFGAVGALSAQFARTARGARGIALAVLGLAFAVRALADIYDISWLRALTPLGWRDVLGPFSTNRIWPLLPMSIMVLMLAGAALWLAGLRELGATIPAKERQRSVRTAPSLKGYSAARLRLRLIRGTALGWGISIFLLTAFFMSLTGEMANLLQASASTEEMVSTMSGGAPPEKSFAAIMATLIGVLLACAAVQLTLVVHNDEQRGLLTPELASGRPRRNVFATAWLGAVGVITTIVVLSSPGAALCAGLSTDTAGISSASAWSVLGQWPAAIAASGFALLIAAIFPRASWLAWLPVAWSGFTSYFGALLKYPDWLLDTSFFAHAPYSSDGAFHWSGAITLIALGTGFAVAGATTVGKRDVTG